MKQEGGGDGRSVRVTVESKLCTHEHAGHSVLTVVDTGDGISTSINGVYSGYSALCMLRAATKMVSSLILESGIDSENLTTLITLATCDGIHDAQEMSGLDAIRDLASDLGMEGPDGER